MRTIPRLAQAHVEITARTGKYKASIADVKRRTEGFGKSAKKALKGVTLGLTAMGVAAGIAAVAIGVKLTRALVRVGRETIKTAVKYDRLKIGLVAIVGSAAEAERQLRRLRVLALAPGLGFEQAIQGSTALQAAGISAELAERSLSAFGNALAIVGKGAQDLSRVNLQLSQIASKTGGFGRDLLVIREAVPSIGPILSKAFDGEPLENMTIAGEELIKVMVAGLEGLGQAGESVGNNLVNLGVSFDLFKGEIGKTMLSITSDTTKSLTGILDTLTQLIPHWEFYQDQVGVVMGNIVTLAVAATGTMFTEMAALIIKLSPIIWQPLWFGFKQAMLGIDDAGARLTGKIMRRLGVISQETFEREMKKVEDSSKEISENMAENFRVGFQKSIDEAVAATQKRVPVIVKAWQDLLVGIQTNLDVLKKEIPEAIVIPVEKAIAKLKKISPGEVEFLSLKPEDPKKIADRLRESEKRILDFNETINKEMRKRQETNLKAFQEVTARQREAAENMRIAFENATFGMRNAFSDFIFDSISDINNISDAWSEFVRNMKSAFIRAAADMIANKAVQSLFAAFENLQAQAGGGSDPDVGRVLQQGFGTAIGAFLGNLVAPGVGAIIGGGVGGAIAGSIGGESGQGNRTIGTVNFFETDLGNMDRNRLQKTVSQTIAPALAEDAVDGR